MPRHYFLVAFFFFLLFLSLAEMTDREVVKCHRTSSGKSRGAQVMARSHPLVLQAKAATSPLGCHVSGVSMEMRQQAQTHTFEARRHLRGESAYHSHPKIRDHLVLLYSWIPQWVCFTLCVLAVLPLRSLLGTLVRCQIRPASLEQASDGDTSHRGLTSLSMGHACYIMGCILACKSIFSKSCLLKISLNNCLLVVFFFWGAKELKNDFVQRVTKSRKCIFEPFENASTCFLSLLIYTACIIIWIWLIVEQKGNRNNLSAL